MQIKPVIKTKNNKHSICSWIISNFPENYNQMRYLEPFVGNGSILLNKLESIEEVVGDLDEELILIWKMIKDDFSNFKRKLSKLKYDEKLFNLLLNKKNDKNKTLNNFLIRKMSKLGNKKIFEEIERKKANGFWKETIESCKVIKNRISNVYFIKKEPVSLIKNFDSENTFCFCCPPPMIEKETQLSTDDYVNITESVLDFRGKVVFLGNSCTFYKRIFKEWKTIKKKTSNKNDCLWINF